MSLPVTGLQFSSVAYRMKSELLCLSDKPFIIWSHLDLNNSDNKFGLFDANWNQYPPSREPGTFTNIGHLLAIKQISTNFKVLVSQTEAVSHSGKVHRLRNPLAFLWLPTTPGSSSVTLVCSLTSLCLCFLFCDSQRLWWGKLSFLHHSKLSQASLPLHLLFLQLHMPSPCWVHLETSIILGVSESNPWLP